MPAACSCFLRVLLSKVNRSFDAENPLVHCTSSGYAIASQALTAVMRAHDGRGPSTTLTEAILKALDLASAEDLIGYPSFHRCVTKLMSYVQSSVYSRAIVLSTS